MKVRTMRILIINYYYPPVVDAHAYRWEQIARHWVAQGHQVEVITGRVLGVPNYSVDAGVRVTRAGLIGRPAKLSSAVNATSGVVAKLQAGLLNLLRPIYRLFYWPDAVWHWVPSAMLEAVRKRSTKYDLVISYYPCFAAHLAAATLKRWSKFSEMTWVADYGDPFSTSTSMPPNNFALFGWLNKIAERHIARQVDMLVFTNERTASTYYESGVCSQDKTHVIPHLVDVEKFYNGENGALLSSPSNSSIPSAIHLLYIGGFHRGIREPYLLFDVIRQLNQNVQQEFILTIYGPANGFDLSPADCPQIRYKGMVERESAIHLMSQAEILINVENINCVMLPSKMVECIATGKPLLNLSSGGRDNLIVEKYMDCQFALRLTRDVLNACGIDAIARFIAGAAGKVASRQAVECILEGYILPNVANQYLEMVRKFNKSIDT